MKDGILGLVSGLTGRKEEDEKDAANVLKCIFVYAALSTYPKLHEASNTLPSFDQICREVNWPLSMPPFHMSSLVYYGGDSGINPPMLLTIHGFYHRNADDVKQISLPDPGCSYLPEPCRIPRFALRFKEDTTVLIYHKKTEEGIQKLLESMKLIENAVVKPASTTEDNKDPKDEPSG
jgi:hypothetical protein